MAHVRCGAFDAVAHELRRRSGGGKGEGDENVRTSATPSTLAPCGFRVSDSGIMSVSADGGVRAEGRRGHARALQLLANTVLTCLAYETDSECKRAQLECLVALPPHNSIMLLQGCGGRACWGACWWRGTQSAVGG
jgi:hypothetical protein